MIQKLRLSLTFSDILLPDPSMAYSTVRKYDEIMSNSLSLFLLFYTAEKEVYVCVHNTTGLIESHVRSNYTHSACVCTIYSGFGQQ